MKFSIAQLVHLFRVNKSFYIFSFLNFLFVGMFLIAGNYRHMPRENFSDLLFIIIHAIIVSMAYYSILYLISLSRKPFLILYPLFNTITAMGIYYSFTLDISITSALLDSALNTSWEESSALISFQFIAYTLGIAVISFWLAFYRYRKLKIKLNIPLFILPVLGIFLSHQVNSIRYKTISHRLPFSIYEASKKLYEQRKLLKENKIAIHHNLSYEADSLEIVFVLGEAVRADHLSLNGYKRKTTPHLDQEELISFRNIYTPWTHTNQAVPYILTRASKQNPDPAYQEASFISLFTQAGFQTAWLGNQNPGNTYLAFTKEVDEYYLHKSAQTVYNYAQKNDLELLPFISEQLNKPNPNKFVFIHSIGSHWYYNSHYPDSLARFQPVCANKDLSAENRGRIINSYDNSILCMDVFIHSIIESLRKKKAILVYCSDHGELLGEEGKWLHAQDTPYEKNPACFIWLSESYKLQYPKAYQALKECETDSIEQSFIFHNLLELAQLETPVKDSTEVLTEVNKDEKH